MDSDKVIEKIKELCSNSLDVNFEDLEIKFVYMQTFLGIRNVATINEYVEIVNKKERFCYSAGGCADEEYIAKIAFKGYLKEQDLYYKEKRKQEAEEKERKEHPFLSLFK